MWYLVQTKCREELRAQSHLERQGYECYCPTDKDGPFFPGYLFVREEDRDYAPIKSTRGVMKLVGFPEPLPVHDSLIDEYRRTDWARSDQCAPGSKVRTNDLAGVYAHIEAIVQAKKGDRVLLLINMMGSQQSVLMPLKAVAQAH